MRLIDADALKEYVKKVEDYESAYTVCGYIDNAPTVPLPDFKEGYKQAIIDGKTNYSRMQGEWLRTVNEFLNWECSLCHKPHDFKDNFCPNCGAKMKGGTE